MASRHRVVLPVALLVLLGVAGRGGGQEARPTAHSAAPTTHRTTVYILADRGAAPIGVRRSVPRHSPHARRALAALLAGPTADERKRGIMTALPSGTRVLSLRLAGRGSTLAVVDLAGLPPADGRRGAEATTGQRVRVITQVARTLIGLSGIERVELRSDGRPWDLWTMDGRIVATATDYERLTGWTRVCGGRSADERRLGLSRCFSALP